MLYIASNNAVIKTDAHLPTDSSTLNPMTRRIKQIFIVTMAIGSLACACMHV